MMRNKELVAFISGSPIIVGVDITCHIGGEIWVLRNKPTEPDRGNARERNSMNASLKIQMTRSSLVNLKNMSSVNVQTDT